MTTTQSDTAGMQGGVRDGMLFHALAAAVILSALNALKPVHLDDVIWWYFADHITRDPLNPFAFTIPWAQHCHAAMGVMSPPVLPYYWAGAITTLGDVPALWKLAQFPLVLMLALALFDLARRFAPDLAMPLGWAMTLSPSLLPAQNLMQDIPAAAFALAALAVVLRACEAHRLPLALLGGVLLGLACLTKWSALAGFGTVGLACLIFAPSWRWAFYVPGVAGVMFVGWEGYLLLSAGESHFLHHLLLASEAAGGGKFRGLLLGLATYIGGLVPLVAILGYAGRGALGGMGVAVGLVFVAGYVALAALGTTTGLANPLTGRPLRLDTPLFLAFGVLVWSGLALSVLRAAPARRGGAGSPPPVHLLFLLGWLAVELVGYFALSPFPAARRVILLVVPMCLLAAAAAHGRIRPGAAWWAAGVQLAIALLYTAVDTANALKIRTAADWAAATVADRGGGTVWFKGEFGFEYYATRAGLRPACEPGFDAAARPDDRLVVFSLGDTPRKPGLVADLEPEHAREFTHPLPWTTMGFGYYIGRRPLEAAHGRLGSVQIYRIGDASAAQD